MGEQDTRPDRILRYRNRTSYLAVWALVMVAYILAFAVWLVWYTSHDLLAGSVTLSARPFAVFALVVGVLLIVMAFGLAVVVLRPSLLLTPNTLRIVRAFHTIRLSVNEITGVGLLFEQVAQTGMAKPTPAWRMRVWHRTGDPRGEPVAIAYRPRLRSRHDPHGREKFLAVMPAPSSDGASGEFSIDTFDAATETDPAKMEATYAGRVAREIYQRVLAQQGPTGPLAATEQQKHVVSGGRFADVEVLAFWSPDGVFGRPAPGSSSPVA